jgi:hypothetical protein
MIFKYIVWSFCLCPVFVWAAEQKPFCLIPKEGESLKISLPQTVQNSQEQRLPMFHEAAQYIPLLRAVEEKKYKEQESVHFPEIRHTPLKMLLHAIYFHKTLPIKPYIFRPVIYSCHQKCQNITDALEAADFLLITRQQTLAEDFLLRSTKYTSFVPCFLGMYLSPFFYDTWLEDYNGKEIIKKHKYTIWNFLSFGNTELEITPCKKRLDGTGCVRLTVKERLRIYIEMLHQTNTEKK